MVDFFRRPSSSRQAKPKGLEAGTRRIDDSFSAKAEELSLFSPVSRQPRRQAHQCLGGELRRFSKDTTINSITYMLFLSHLQTLATIQESTSELVRRQRPLCAEASEIFRGYWPSKPDPVYGLSSSGSVSTRRQAATLCCLRHNLR